jgi:hypothetical protein
VVYCAFTSNSVTARGRISSAAMDTDAGEFRDFSELELKPDHQSRPFWVTPDGLIILEAFSPWYARAYDFLVAIAEPVSRPELIHKYKLTSGSLYAAVSVNIETESIIHTLGLWCKTELPEEVVAFIRNCTATFGKAKVVLKANKFYVESSFPDILRELLKYKTISNARIYDDPEPTEGDSQTGAGAGAGAGATTVNDQGFVMSTAAPELRRNLAYSGPDSSTGAGYDDDDEDDFGEDAQMDTSVGYGHALQKVSFMIAQDQVQVRQRNVYSLLVIRYCLIQYFLV